jgi:hypothetical protein
MGKEVSTESRGFDDKILSMCALGIATRRTRRPNPSAGRRMAAPDAWADAPGAAHGRAAGQYSGRGGGEKIGVFGTGDTVRRP